MNTAIRIASDRRGISRLCHLTPFRNLVHIATGNGLLSSQHLKGEERQVFNEQDPLRLDRHSDYISCSIEYPNAWYLRSRQRNLTGEDRNFPDWVCLTIKPEHLWADTTLLCPRNAASAGGELIGGGIEAFNSMYEARVRGARGMVFSRHQLPAACPTDEQAEVLVYRHIPLPDILNVIVVDEAQAGKTYVALSQVDARLDLSRLRICPEFFNPGRLSALLRSGSRPNETNWDCHGSVHE